MKLTLGKLISFGKKDDQKYICKVCNHKFDSDEELSKDMRYCGYCEAVHLGEPDPSWLPSIKGDDINIKGFRKL